MKTSARNGAQLDSIVEFAPSFGWLGLMLLPLAFQYRDLHETGRSLQLALVSGIAVLLFLADWLCFNKAADRPPGMDRSPARPWLVLTGLGFLLPVATHLFLMPKIPLVAVLLDKDATENALTLLRLNSTKLLAVPPVISYMFNWAMVVFAPTHIIVALFTGRRWQALLVLVLAGLYAAATLARLPLVLLLATCVVASCVMPGPARRRLCVGLVCLVLLGFGFIGVLFASGTLVHLKSASGRAQSPVLAQMQPDDPRRALTYGDNFRYEPDPAELPRSKLQAMLEYAVYRAWLTPSDVSNRWYQYFIYVQKEPLGLRNFFPARGGAATEAPSRAVGLWAYRARFPHKYWDTISAYASFDADAFAHGGIPGVAVAVILLVLARVGAACLLTVHPVGLASYGVFLSALAILPSSASLQAIFGANGLFIVLLVLLGIRLLAYAAKGKAGVAGGSL